ncbi:MAG: spore maturation protein [Rhodospirillaceae bacterium]|nr:spore maturation protein [Rhodospirillaceae bacterium]
MNVIFFLLVLVAFTVTAWKQVLWDPASGLNAPMQVLGHSMIETAGTAVTLALGLVGVMGLFLGLMKIAEVGGLLRVFAKLLRPLMVRLFPEVPKDHPAMGAMIMNLSANALGLGNAATPFGIRAMQELDTLNPNKGMATNSMILFLAINTSSVTLLPTGIIALRAAAGSDDPAGILPTTLFATLLSTTIAIMTAKFFSRMGQSKSNINTGSDINLNANHSINARSDDLSGKGYPVWVSILALVSLITLIPMTVIFGGLLSPWIIPALIMGFLTFGMFRGVRIYESFVDGAEEGFKVAIKIIPYLIAILVAVGMLRSSGALELFVGFLGPITSIFGLPGDALPMALLRPLSGSGAYGIVASAINDPNIGPDSYTGYLVSTLQGSTETTFYVLAVYFGAIQIKRIRYALVVALTADAAGVAGAIIACTYLFG